MKKISKVVAILLTLALAAITASALFACNGSKTKIAIITDIHILAQAQIGNADSKSYMDKDASSQKMLYISEAIFRTALDKIVESKATTLLIAGDLTEDGSKVSHEMVASELKKLEEKGVDVYVINGNHDILNSSKSYEEETAESIPNVSRAEFQEIYADFGYSEALSTYEGTLSYTADIGKDYRLVAIDACTYTMDTNGKIIDRNSPNMTDGLIDWAAEQVAKAKDDRRIPLGMMHFPLVQHLGSFLESTGISDNGKVNKSEQLAAALSEAGLNYIFTGHLHSQDITVYEDDNGKVFDVETGCLSNYPSPIRYLTADRKSISLTTELLDGVTASYIPEYAQSDSYYLVNEFQKFAGEFVEYDMIGKFKSKISESMIASLLASADIDNPESMAPTIKSVFVDSLLDSFLTMDIYGDSNSLQEIASDYGITLPETQYTTIMSVVTSFIRANYAGDENIASDSNEAILIKYSIYSIFSVLGQYYNGLKSIIGSLPDIDLELMAESLFTTNELDLTALDIGEMISPVLSDFFEVELSDDINEILTTLSTLEFEELLFGIELQNYLDGENGTIRIGALLDYILFDIAKENLTLDKAPADNNIKINKKTLEVTSL